MLLASSRFALLLRVGRVRSLFMVLIVSFVSLALLLRCLRGYGVLSVSTTSSGCSTLLYQFRTVVNQAVVVIDQVALTRQVSNGAGKEIRRDAAIALE